MSSRLFQGVIVQMKDSITRSVGIMDMTMTVVASSDLSEIGEAWKDEVYFTSPPEYPEILIQNGYTYIKLGSRQRDDYTVFVEGDDELAASIASVLRVTLSNLKEFFDEKYDRDDFIKNVMLDNVLPGDIYYKAKELGFVADAHRILFLVRVGGKPSFPLFDILSELFPNKEGEFVVSLAESDAIVIKEVPEGSEFEDLVGICENVRDTLLQSHQMRCSIGVGSISRSLMDLGKAYKESQIALDVGKVLDREVNIISYENLGIGRLIYQLPTTLCEMFLAESFKHGSINSLDEETLTTIQKFFENNLNVSEAARKLFIHRNTLVYRLEKIKKMTGLDIREFDNAVSFKVALMVNRYLAANTSKF